jgi:hypothetical protein
LKGRFIMTDVVTVMKDSFWQEDAANAKLTVNCIGFRTGAQRLAYPMSSAISQKFYVETRNRINLPAQFSKSYKLVEAGLYLRWSWWS